MRASAGNRVLMLLENSYFPLDSRVRLEAGTLVNAGYQVAVIAPVFRDQPWHEVLDGVSVYRFPIRRSGGSVLGYVWEYGVSMVATFLLSLWVFVRHGFDVVHTHNPPDLFVFIAAFYKAFGKQFVYDHHDLSPEMYVAQFGGDNGALVHRVLVWLEKLSCRMADHVIATNESYRAVEIGRGNVSAKRITIVRNGPNLRRLIRVSPDPELRQKAKTLLGYVGVMGLQDGVDHLLRALHHLIHDCGRTDFYCVLIGSGAALGRLRAQATELGLDDHVCFTGYVPDEDLVRYLSTVDICVDPDPSNPFTDRSTMIKMMEYMAMRKPIVAFDLPEHRVTAKRAALYARPNDERDFARQIAVLMDDPARREEMGRFGRLRVEKELAWPHQEQCLLQAYRKLGMPLKAYAFNKPAEYL
jgi:glycosyltransferase involved in cell wall biosynthesis